MIRRLFVSCLVLAGAAAHAADDYTATVETWRADRYASLRQPEGWFSFIGSGIVNTGTSTVGSAADNAIVLPSGPKHVGTLTLGADGVPRFRVLAESGARIEGTDSEGEQVLKTNLDGKPTRVTFGSRWFYVVKSGDTTGWRLRDTESPARKAFTHIEHFPVDATWRVQADWVPFDPPRAIELVTIINTLEKATVPGKAVFERDGKRYELEPVTEDDGRLFFIIADRTSGKETYGAARFLYADAPKDGKVELDFNKAYNPPCALSPHVVCPTAPPGNRLGLRVEAGEKTYAKAH